MTKYTIIDDELSLYKEGDEEVEGAIIVDSFHEAKRVIRGVYLGRQVYWEEKMKKLERLRSTDLK